MKTILITGLSLAAFTGLAVLADYSGKLLVKAQIAQTEYLCETGHEASCHKLSLWTGGQCASPRMVGGCRYDSYIITQRLTMEDE